ncbi:hypothetical protein LXG23DRAFT_50045 [Yarrowia lipolytica]|uniref:BTB domain-containing protein n=1 Tax=Yarrowia lipolytica TaxID=4952 RepID=A0A1H6Q5L3_YARLL|nr:hypothetical protein YALI1_B01030g [Yarrowia lipolytica]KAB8281515.1 hypothetical protein BKA91DRAFT_115555 [Yarrowia lipolytica]KAE8172888.1 hypothetical protein BKA90DRAFT_161895 [Yarrowia lipolytica]KAJ8051943.1 hypothetical protein LXG23DRAFT_50045 [Yarrowia lipolytica]SEI34341.1 YALIA101S04e16468g1_1 [Yarrowia lipolytica]
MIPPITFPYYHEISDRYGLVFPDSTPSNGLHDNFINPLLKDWHTDNVTVLWLILRGMDTPSLKSHDDIEAFQMDSERICLRIFNNYYELFPTSESLVKAQTPHSNGSRFQSLKLLSQMKLDRQNPCSVVKYTAQLESSAMYSRVLKLLLKDKTCDFTITSTTPTCSDSGSDSDSDSDSDSFPVHSFLLTNLWPFFKAVSSAEMVEKETQTLHLPFPKDCVEILVAFFYGNNVQNTSWSLSLSLSLLEMSALYDIPELKNIAIESIVSSAEPLSLSVALKAWKVANESDAPEVEAFLGPYLKRHVSEIEASEESEEFSESQLLQLLLQIVRL